MTYQDTLNETKKHYPFSVWRQNFDQGFTQYTEDNCNSIKDIFDHLINNLIEAGESASEEQKVQLFRKAILETNKINMEVYDLIEEGEREDLCELTNEISIACGLTPKKYGEGEGLASEWREW